MTENLICAYDFTSSGKAVPLDEGGIFKKLPKGNWRWIHLQRHGPDVLGWLMADDNIPESAVHLLLAEETRPTVHAMESGHIINLRGVNLNPDAAPEDMVAVRIWVEKDRIITLRKPRIVAVQAIRELCEAGEPPDSIGDFLSQLVGGLIERMDPVIANLDDRLDSLEETELEEASNTHRNRLGHLRRQAIALKRFLSPQRDALSKLSMLKVSWLLPEHVQAIHEAHDHTSRMVEALDAIRERAGLLHEEFSSQMAEKNNRNSYVLAVIAAIFLPLGFLTGLLGINVGGVPGVDSPWGFAAVTLLVIVLGIAEFAVLRWMRWI